MPLEPFAVKITRKSNCSSSIRVQFKVGGGRDKGVKEKGAPIPF